MCETNFDLPVILGQELLQSHETVAFAESCSGGLASSFVTDVAGSSAYLLGSVVTYTNEIKQKLLHVQKKTIAEYGAVSEQTAREMAQGARQLFTSDYGVGITGNAGPSGSEGKPVGLVYIAVADKDSVTVREFHFTADRIANKQKIALTAISMVIDKIREKKLEEDI